MTDSKVVVWDALANKAILEQAREGAEEAPVTIESLTNELERVFGAPAKQASSLVSRETLKPPKVSDARSPATLQRVGLSLLDPEVAVDQAFARVGVTKEMIPQLMESPNWQATMARICQQYLFVTGMPKLVSAQMKKAWNGDTGAAKLLVDMFGKAEMDLDEQTKALVDATPETRLRATEALIEDLQRIVDTSKGKASSRKVIEDAQARAVASAQERKKGTGR